jgi:hypothetical protein
VEFFLAGVKSGQKDRDRRPRQICRHAQIADHRCAIEWNRYPLHRRVGIRGAALIASQHPLMSGEVLLRVVGEEVFCIVIIDRRAQIGFGRGDVPVALGRL